MGEVRIFVEHGLFLGKDNLGFKVTSQVIGLKV